MPPVMATSSALPPPATPGPCARARRYFHVLCETTLGRRRHRGALGRVIFGAGWGFGLGVAVGLAAPPPDAASGRWWRFDEPATAVAGAVLADAGPGAFHLTLGRGASIVPGHSGGALRPGADSGEPAAWRESPSGVSLPATDWTLSFWLWLDREAEAEGVIFETGIGPRGRGPLVQRVSVVPRENALVFSAPAVDPGSAVIGQRVEFSRPDGPPHGVALVQSVTLAVTGTPWPRAVWTQVVLGYDATGGQLRLLLDGHVRAVGSVRLEALPPGGGYLVVGSDGRGGRRLRGAIDDLQIHEGVRSGARPDGALRLP